MQHSNLNFPLLEPQHTLKQFNKVRGTENGKENRLKISNVNITDIIFGINKLLQVIDNIPHIPPMYKLNIMYPVISTDYHKNVTYYAFRGK